MNSQRMVLTSFWILALAYPTRGDDLPSFPGAQGFGALAVGGRGGDVYHVTRLDDSGPGSLRSGIQTASGPRTIVFAIGGTIQLQSPLTISKSLLTIAGQTAPGDGVTVAGYPTNIAGVSDVIIRHMRFRTGDFNVASLPSKVGNGNMDLSGDAADSLSISNSWRVMIDHVSTSWGMDEVLSVTRSNNVTVQNSIIGEALHDSFHAEGPHGYGSLVRGRR